MKITKFIRLSCIALFASFMCTFFVSGMAFPVPDRDLNRITKSIVTSITRNKQYDLNFALQHFKLSHANNLIVRQELLRRVLAMLGGGAPAAQVAKAHTIIGIPAGGGAGGRGGAGPIPHRPGLPGGRPRGGGDGDGGDGGRPGGDGDGDGGGDGGGVVPPAPGGRDDDVVPPAPEPRPEPAPRPAPRRDEDEGRRGDTQRQAEHVLDVAGDTLREINRRGGDTISPAENHRFLELGKIYKEFATALRKAVTEKQNDAFFTRLAEQIRDRLLEPAQELLAEIKKRLVEAELQRNAKAQEEAAQEDARQKAEAAAAKREREAAEAAKREREEAARRKAEAEAAEQRKRAEAEAAAAREAEEARRKAAEAAATKIQKVWKGKKGRDAAKLEKEIQKLKTQVTQLATEIVNNEKFSDEIKAKARDIHGYVGGKESAQELKKMLDELTKLKREAEEAAPAAAGGEGAAAAAAAGGGEKKAEPADDEPLVVNRPAKQAKPDGGQAAGDGGAAAGASGGEGKEAVAAGGEEEKKAEAAGRKAEAVKPAKGKEALIQQIDAALYGKTIQNGIKENDDFFARYTELLGKVPRSKKALRATTKVALTALKIEVEKLSQDIKKSRKK